ncbi:MAG: HipA domain-containing protein [Dehalococcoidia bacterium]
MQGLAVWLYGAAVAMIERHRTQLRLTYTDEALRKYEAGTPLLSVALPLTPSHYPNSVVRSFLDGLLPEGDVRRLIAAELDVRESDTYSLIEALGRECAGALVIQPVDWPAPPPPTTLRAEPMSQRELEERIRSLKDAPLGVDARVRLSLAGVQEKLVLTRMPDGSWGRPVDGTPSTHIFKPETAAYPATVANEAFCMRVAKRMGLQVANVETATIGGREVLIVERYDRVVHPDGNVERIHQEDFCQALGIHPTKKYQADGGPSLRQVAAILRASADTDSLERLLRAVTFNVIIGNADAHGKNFSIMHDELGVLRFAPLYDLISTLLYATTTREMAMFIDDVRRIDHVAGERLVNEASSWGLSKRRANEIVQDMVQRAPSSADAIQNDIPNMPPELRTVFDNQLKALRTMSSTH